MKTIISKINYNKEDDEIYSTASNILRSGGLVAFPTETVYGLGADALDEKASSKIYAAKGRPSDNPLIVHISKFEDLYELSSDVNENAKKVAEAFWPGPVTMILKKKDIVPDSITGGLSTVAVRMPSHPVARRLIQESGVFIAAPSANISGKPSPTKAEHVIKDMDGRIDMIIEEDKVDIGVESTIVDLSDKVPVVLRPGFITRKQLEKVLGEVQIDPAISKGVESGIVPKAPGMKYKHYSPDASVVIVHGDKDAVIGSINEFAAKKMAEGAKVAIMTTSENAPRYHADVISVLGSYNDEAAIAKNLFAALRDMDTQNVDFVYSESFPADNVGQAVMNRLIKAAGHTIIEV